MDPSLTDSAWRARPRYAPGPPRGSWRRQLAVTALAVALFAWAGSFLYGTFLDPRMGAAAAGRALTARIHNGGIYRCHHIENDGTIPMRDVDYVCTALNKPILSGYWIGTDRDSITELEPSG